jgi:predicted RNA-binding Zn-ribbon protein involved in translation (DUF1610 family)
MTLDDLENWEPEVEIELEPVKPDIQSMLKHASPYREDKKAKERLEKAVKAWSRRFECPGCGIDKNVDPTFVGDEWHYYGQCSHCGQRWAQAYYLMVKCEECGKKVPMTSRNPEGRCKCQGERRPF